MKARIAEQMMLQCHLAAKFCTSSIVKLIVFIEITRFTCVGVQSLSDVEISTEECNNSCTCKWTFQQLVKFCKIFVLLFVYNTGIYVDIFAGESQEVE